MNSCDHSDTTNINHLQDGNHLVQVCEKCQACKTCDGRWIQDTTGLCTVREFAAEIWANRRMISRFNPAGAAEPGVAAGGMTFIHEGKRYTVEMVVTKCEPI